MFKTNMLALAVILLQLQLVHSYAKGGPTKSCKSLRPGHGRNSKVFPYSIRTSTNFYDTDKEIEVWVVPDGSYALQGLMMQARESNGSPVGQWTDVQQGTDLPPALFKKIDCSGTGDTVTQTSNDDKQSGTFKWKTSAKRGVIKFHASVLHDKNKYILIESESLMEVGGQGPPVTPTPRQESPHATKPSTHNSTPDPTPRSPPEGSSSEESHSDSESREDSYDYSYEESHDGAQESYEYSDEESDEMDDGEESESTEDMGESYSIEDEYDGEYDYDDEYESDYEDEDEEDMDTDIDDKDVESDGKEPVDPKYDGEPPRGGGDKDGMSEDVPLDRGALPGAERLYSAAPKHFVSMMTILMLNVILQWMIQYHVM